MKNVFIDRPFLETPLRVIMVGAMPALTKNPGSETSTTRLLERERKMPKKGPKEFLPGPQDPLTCPA